MYHNSKSIASNSTVPRVLNQWNMYTAETPEKTEELKEILSKAHVQAAKLMKQII